MIQGSLRVYPDAKQFTFTSNHYGADTGFIALYYWSPDHITQIQAHYESFALPFIIDQWDEIPITAYHPYGKSLDSMPSSEHLRCGYKQRYACVNVHLYSVDEHGQDNIPDLSQRPNRAYVAPDLTALTETTGTVIVHSYYRYHE